MAAAPFCMSPRRVHRPAARASQGSPRCAADSQFVGVEMGGILSSPFLQFSARSGRRVEWSLGSRDHITTLIGEWSIARTLLAGWGRNLENCECVWWSKFLRHFVFVPSKISSNYIKIDHIFGVFECLGGASIF